MDYSKTVNLPVTDFPMKANLPQREPETLKKWKKMNIYAFNSEIKGKCRPLHFA